MRLTCTNTSHPSRPGSNSNERVLPIPQISHHQILFSVIPRTLLFLKGNYICKGYNQYIQSHTDRDTIYSTLACYYILDIYIMKTKH